MLRLKTQRAWKKADYTIGRFFVNDARFYESLEDTDRGINSNYSVASIRLIKIAGRTAIPSGVYKVVLSVSPRFKSKAWAARYGGLVPEILGVKGFSGVRIHPGNTAADTDGCILIGENKAKGALVNSQKRYLELMDKYLIPAWNRKEEITITVE